MLRALGYPPFVSPLAPILISSYFNREAHGIAISDKVFEAQAHGVAEARYRIAHPSIVKLYLGPRGCIQGTVYTSLKL